MIISWFAISWKNLQSKNMKPSLKWVTNVKKCFWFSEGLSWRKSAGLMKFVSRRCINRVTLWDCNSSSQSTKRPVSQEFTQTLIQLLAFCALTVPNLKQPKPLKMLQLRKSQKGIYSHVQIFSHRNKLTKYSLTYLHQAALDQMRRQKNLMKKRAP